MKYCPDCNFENRVNAEHCAACGHVFNGGAPVSVDGGASLGAAASPERPDGSLPMLFGWIALGASVLFEILAVSADEVAGAWAATLAAGGFFSLFLVLWGVGYIVRAISFLPGRETS